MSAGRRFGIAVIAVVALTMATAPMASARRSRPRTETSSKFCESFVEYYGIQKLAAVLSGFAGIGGGGTSDIQTARATVLMLLSPKLAAITRELAATSDKALVPYLKKERAAYRKGIALLREAGASQSDIATLAKLSLADLNDEGPSALDNSKSMSEQAVKDAGKEFLPIIRASQSSTTAASARALNTASVECGVVHDPAVKCDDLFSTDEASEIVGADVTLDDKQGCEWTNDDDDLLAVSVLRTVANFDQYTDEFSEPVRDLGEEAVIKQGHSTSTGGGTSGYTVYVLTADSTVKVSMDRDDDDVSEKEIADVARDVLAKL